VTRELSPLAPGDWLDVPAALELLPVGKSLLYRLVGEREIEAIRVGSVASRRPKWLISRRSLEEYVERRRATMAPREIKADPDKILARLRARGRGA